ncbi:MAG: hypothetical protein AAB784_02680 [Patescibacteria group bacterium]
MSGFERGPANKFEGLANTLKEDPKYRELFSKEGKNYLENMIRVLVNERAAEGRKELVRQRAEEAQAQEDPEVKALRNMGGLED